MDEHAKRSKPVREGVGGLAVGAGVVLIAAACCGGIPLLLVLSAAAGTAGVIGGVAAFAAVAGLGLAVFLLRGARRRKVALRLSCQTRPGAERPEELRPFSVEGGQGPSPAPAQESEVHA